MRERLARKDRVRNATPAPAAPRSRTHDADVLQPSIGNPAIARNLSDAQDEREADAVAEHLVLGDYGSPGLSRARRGTGNLPLPLRELMELRFGHDFSNVRVYSDSAAAHRARAVGARAYTLGRGIHFAQNEYAPATAEGRKLLAHELTHVVQQSGDAAGGGARPRLQRKEVQNVADIKSKKDWTSGDREEGKTRWNEACLVNLNDVDSTQYVRSIERRDFYKWFYEYAAAMGFTTRWALAAYVVANGAHQIADIDAFANDVFGLANIELQGVLREGNQVIFDNVLPKLKKLIDGGPLKGPAALKWDMQVLAEEQTLIQPLYDRISKTTVEQLDFIARKKGVAIAIGTSLTDSDEVPKGRFNKEGTVPAFNQTNIRKPADRWRYGMHLGNVFAPAGTGYDPNKDAMPLVAGGYSDGTELAKVDTRRYLHVLDAWLSPERLTRTGVGADLQAIIAGLSSFEKDQILLDRSGDGWAYSVRFAQFGFITETMVRQTLPAATTSNQAAIAFFMKRYKDERKRVDEEMQWQRSRWNMRHD
jgi:hypothetical protein